MRPCRMTALSLFVILMLPGLTLAIPHLLNYQGRLTDGTGSPITTPATVEFRVYNVPTGGTELWMESQTVTPNTDGLFSIELGSAIPIPDSALSGSEAWLEIKIDTDPPIFPRTRLSAVPYARIASSYWRRPPSSE